MNINVLIQYSFHDFSNTTYKRNGAIIWLIRNITLLKNGDNIGYFPLFRIFALFERFVKKNIHNVTAICSWDICNILWLMISGPDALFTVKFVITSTMSSSLQRMSLIELPVLDSKSGNTTCSSSIPEIQLKYLLKRSHFSLSSCTILASISSTIFLSRGKL